MSKKRVLIIALTFLSVLIILSTLPPGAASNSKGANTIYLPVAIRPPAEYWIQAYGSPENESGQAVLAAPDGGAILLLEQGSGSPNNVLVVKLTAAGPIQWQKVLTSGGGDFLLNGRITSDGGVIISGLSEAGGNTGAQLVRLNSAGGIVWQKQYGGLMLDFAQSVQETADGGYIFSGYTASFGTAISNLWLVKLDQNGTIQWQKAYATNIFHYSTAVQQTTDGGYIVTGYASAGDYIYDLWVLKTDSSGSLLWQKTFGGPGQEYGRSVRQTSNGGYLVVGSTASFGAGGSDGWILKLDNSGAVLWQKSYGGPNDDQFQSLHLTNNGRFAVAGTTKSFGNGGSDAWLLLLAPDGSIIWQKTYGGLQDDTASSIQQSTNGKFLASGSTNTYGSGQRDAWVMKLSPDGDVANCNLSGMSLATIMNTPFIGQANPVTTTPSTAVLANTMIPVLNGSLETVPLCWW